MTNRRLELAFAALFLSLYPAIPVAVARFAVVETPQCERPQQHSTTRRLAVFVIDSLGADEATDGRHYRRIHERFAGRPQGVVRECVDAVTVPCVRAMTTGQDSFSLISLVENFAAERTIPEGSVVRSLLERGAHVGFVGDEDLAAMFEGVTHLEVSGPFEDAKVVERGTRWLREGSVDLAVMHLHRADHVAHREGVDSAAYAAALEETDRLVDESIASLPPGVDVLITGDHGHDARGRHAAGLDVPTYAWSSSRSFEALGRPGYGIEDHASGIAAVFGIDRHLCAPDERPSPPTDVVPEAPSATEVGAR